MRHAVLLLALFAGCSSFLRGKQMYPGPRRGKGEVATVRMAGYPGGTDPGIEITTVRIVRFDGRPVDVAFEWVEVLPGGHEFVLEWSWTDLPWRDFDKKPADWNYNAGSTKLTVEAVAGALYALTWDPKAQWAPTGFRRVR